MAIVAENRPASVIEHASSAPYVLATMHHWLYDVQWPLARASRWLHALTLTDPHAEDIRATLLTALAQGCGSFATTPQTPVAQSSL